MKNIKMIVTDLDNTLLRTDKTISDYTAGILNKCRQNGIKIVFATARPKRVTVEYLEQIPTDAVINHNGAVIYENEQQIFHSGISPDITKNISYSISRDFPKSTISIEINDVLYTTSDNLPWENIKIKNADFSDLPGKPAEKIITRLSYINSDIKSLEKYLPNDLYVEMDSEKTVFIMNRKAKKSLAVKFLAERYGYNISEVLTFGDDFNDVEMLRECGVGVAVSNAIDEAKAVADYICDTNDNDGVAKWLEKNIL